MQALTPAEVAKRLARAELVLLDVREAEELALSAIPGALHIPRGEVAARLTELDPEQPYAVLCHHGIRSAQVTAYLLAQDFAEVWNVRGGIERWALEVDSSLPRY